MSTSPRDQRIRTPIALAAVAALPFALTACDIDGSGSMGGGFEVEHTVEQQYFAGDGEFVGTTVTLDTTVTEVLTPRSFVIDASTWGDESVLMLFVRDTEDVQEATGVHITGTVKRFNYDDYAGTYDLADKKTYEPFDGEEFVVATTVATTGHAARS